MARFAEYIRTFQTLNIDNLHIEITLYCHLSSGRPMWGCMWNQGQYEGQLKRNTLQNGLRGC